MKVFFLIRSLNYGGAQRQLVVLATGLAERGHDVSVVTYYPGAPLAEPLEAAGVSVRSLDKRGRWDIARFFFRFVRLLRRERPDVLHAYLPTSNLFAVCASIAVPSMWVVWGVRAAEMELSAFDFWSRAPYALQRMCHRWVDLVICNSHAAAREMRRTGLGDRNLAVVPNGFDTDRFRSYPEAGRRLRKSWGVADQAPLVGLVARIDPMKDHETFIRAVARVAEASSDARFICVGGGEPAARQRLQELADTLGLSNRLLWVGDINPGEMPAVYSALDLLVLSSIAESFPNVVGEALACGIPVVASDVGDVAELIDDSGLIVGRRDAEALADGIRDILGRSPAAREALGQAGAARISRYYSRARMIDDTEQLLKAIS